MAPRLISSELAELFVMKRGGDESHHVSSIIRKIKVKLGDFTEDGPGPQQIRLEMGSAFEDAVASALAQRICSSDPGRYIRPGEQVCEGLIGNPDLFDVDDYAIEEVKLTWMSSNHEPDSKKFWHYWVQIMAYCYMMGSNIGRLRVAHINGNYDWNRAETVHYRVWEDVFTDAQLRNNWKMLLSNV